MKVLILYAKIGNGHFKAAEAIKQALEDKYKNVEIFFEDGLEYTSPATNKVIINSYQTLIRHNPELWGTIYQKADTKEKRAVSEINKTVNKMLTIRLKKMLRKIKPDVIVCTHPFISYMCAYLKRKKKTDSKLITVITDYATHCMWMEEHKQIDKFIVASLEVKKDLIEFGIEKTKILDTGIPISPNFLKTYNKQQMLNKFGFEDKFTFLFFAGGGLGLGRSSEVFESLLKSDKDFQVIAVTGKNEKQKIEFEEIMKRYNKKGHVIGYTNEVPALMNMADIVITKPGGITSSECLAMVKPILIINPIPGQEALNTLFFLNNGVAMKASDTEPILHVVDIIFEKPIRIEQMKEMCRILNKKNSAYDAAEIIYESIKIK